MVRKDYDSDEEMDTRDEEPTKQNGGAVEDQDNDSDPPEGEYEIEKILDAKRGAFPNNRIGYLVKWKGYGEDDNSWVDELDAEGAKLLIEEYWERNKKDSKSVSRKSDVGPKSRTSASAAGRKSLSTTNQRQDSSEVENATSQKKRGRPPKVIDVDDDDEIEVVHKTKKTKVASTTPVAKRTTGASTTTKQWAKKAKPATPEPEDEDEDEETFADMRKWKSAASWEHIVDHVNTVERTDDGKLYVYFTLNSKGRTKSNILKCREESSLCKDRFPRKLLDFYEDNLRWRKSEVPEDADD